MKTLKNFWLLIILVCNGVVSQSQSSKFFPRVDKRMELMAIAYQLAKDVPVHKTHNPYYAHAITNHFQNFKTHPLVLYVKKTIVAFERDSLDIATWELPSLAVHLSQPPELQALVPFMDSNNTDGWDDRSLLNQQLIELLNRFYQDAQCEDFFSKQKQYYQSLELKYQQSNIAVDTSWIKNFVGLSLSEHYYPILSPYFESGAYMRVNFGNEVRNTHTLFFCDFNDKGEPSKLSDSAIPRLMVHEYVHALVNQIIYRHKPELQEFAIAVIANATVWSRVKDTFYNNWQFLLYESLVRACSIRYMLTAPAFQTTLENEIAIQEKAGFLWMKFLVAELDRYERNRDQYPTLEHFAPELIKFFERTANERK